MARRRLKLQPYHPPQPQPQPQPSQQQQQPQSSQQQQQPQSPQQQHPQPIPARIRAIPAPAPPGNRLVPTPLSNTLPPPSPPTQPFRLLDLPSELRLRIYTFYFSSCPRVLDLERSFNRTHVRPLLSLLRTCRLIYREAAHHFWSQDRAVRIFPTTPGRPFKSKRPLLSRLRPHQRQSLSELELRLGPGWSEPPPGWVVVDALGLEECVRVRRLRVFVECDPSDGVFAGFRKADGFYEAFSANLLEGIIKRLPALGVVEFDAWPSVRQTGALMTALLTVVGGIAVQWGDERGWGREASSSSSPTISDASTSVSITTPPRPPGELTLEQIMDNLAASMAVMAVQNKLLVAG